MTQQQKYCHQDQDWLYNSRLGMGAITYGVEAMRNFIRESRADGFWSRRARRLSERQMMLAWEQYRRDLRELRERLKAKKDMDDELEWLLLFIVQHCDELLHVSAFYNPGFAYALRAADGSLTVPWQADWQQWAIMFISEAVRDPDLDANQSQPGAAPAAPDAAGSASDDAGGADAAAAPTPTPKPKDDDPSPDF